MMRFVNEAVRALDEGVAGAPGEKAATQIDLGVVFGTGFAPFRGGVIKYAESLGAEKVLETLRGLAESCGERFEPWDGIVKRAEQGKSFYEAV